ncbi:uncharacterized protein LOC113272093 [Papaver somniferum]|uniref:uncharacterized protein LOC113272093 n=1 Tax=Papaver somniferum TaxID=3469 RepID=UPI000E6F99CC|nr:uncharacterized protein LOC113272093 [Papaver somniferum]
MSCSRKSSQYIRGVGLFIEFVHKYGGESTLFLRPCRRCKNSKGLESLSKISFHLLRHGIDLTYTLWRFHGESSLAAERLGGIASSVGADAAATVGEDVADNVGGDLAENVGGNVAANLGGNVADNLGDVASDHIIQPDVEGVDENGGLHDTVHCPAETSHSRKHESAYDRARAPLYNSCPSGKTTLNAAVKLNDIKTQYGFSDNGVTALLEMMKEFLPEENTLPAKYPELKKMIQELGMDYITYDACINDCIFYWKDKSEMVKCHVCNEPRYKKVFNEERKLTKVAQKNLRHFPLIPRLQRLYSMSWIAELMLWHFTAQSDINVMRHPVDSSAWRCVDRFSPEFSKEPRNVTLGISTDGFNPNGFFDTNHSCWPVVVQPYNLSPSSCMKREFSILLLLISVPRAPGKDIDVYLEPLIEELIMLWNEGVLTYDSFSKTEFVMRARLLWDIHDYPTLGTLPGCVTHGYLACHHCGEGTRSDYLSFSRKICYMGHRRWLPMGHKIRDDKTNFDGVVEHGTAPWPLSGLQIQQKVANLKTKHGKGKPPAEPSKKLKRRAAEDNEEDDDVEEEVREEKNITEHLLNTIMGNGKSKDSLGARQDLEAMGVKRKLWLKVDEVTGITTMPDGAFAMSRKEKVAFCTILKNLRVPSSFSSNFRNNVNINPPELRNFKSHDDHVTMQYLLPLLVHVATLMPKDLRVALLRISTFFRILLMKGFKGLVRNRRYIKGCIARGYITREDRLCFMENVSVNGEGTHKHTRQAFLDDDDEFADEMPLSKRKNITLTTVKFEQARNWVPSKFFGINDWKRKYAAYINSRKPHGPRNVMRFVIGFVTIIGLDFG